MEARHPSAPDACLSTSRCRQHHPLPAHNLTTQPPALPLYLHTDQPTLCSPYCYLYSFFPWSSLFCFPFIHHQQLYSRSLATSLLCPCTHQLVLSPSSFPPPHCPCTLAPSPFPTPPCNLLLSPCAFPPPSCPLHTSPLPLASSAIPPPPFPLPSPLPLAASTHQPVLSPSCMPPALIIVVVLYFNLQQVTVH